VGGTAVGVSEGTAVGAGRTCVGGATGTVEGVASLRVQDTHNTAAIPSKAIIWMYFDTNLLFRLAMTAIGYLTRFRAVRSRPTVPPVIIARPVPMYTALPR
jgi:hypothetical protein